MSPYGVTRPQWVKEKSDNDKNMAGECKFGYCGLALESLSSGMSADWSVLCIWNMVPDKYSIVNAICTQIRSSQTYNEL